MTTDVNDNENERTPEIQNAIDVALLWRAGKMIGADENEVCDALLREIERLEKIMVKMQEKVDRCDWLDSQVDE